MKKYTGKGVYGAIAIGKVSLFQRQDIQVKRLHIENEEAEIERFEEAKEKAVSQLKEIYEKALVEVGETNAQIFEVHMMMLEDEPESSREICRAFIELVMKSKANVCIIPMQDYLGYDDTTRMNQPSTVGKNWRWRMVDTDLSDTLKEEIICYTRKYLR